MAEKRLTDLLFGNLLDEFGDAAAPVIRRVIRALGSEATETTVRKALRRQGYKPLSQNPLAVQLRGAAKPLAVKPKALPAPSKPLALPAPGPGLPPQASKPRGGQFFTEKADPSISPEAVARKQAEDVGASFLRDADLLAQLGTDADVPFPPEALSVQDWLARSLAKYYKTDFGAPDDPLRDLAARGLHYDVDMTPERWKATVDSYLLEDPIQQILFPPNPMGGMPGAGSNMRGETLAAMPWLAKQPVTDKLYGISGGGLDIGHFADELANALNPEASGLPADLALRPESLARMSFPQAVERVGRINQFRVKQMEDAAQALANNPAVQTFKEYPDAGYRWVELRQPEYGPDMLPEGFGLRVRDNQQGGTYHALVDELDGGRELGAGQTPEAAIKAAQKWLVESDTSLADALKYEGDTMGHCVGGYCDDVLSGRSRIFSLRDAKGQPHVTIETSPRRMPQQSGLIYRVPDDVSDELFEQAGGDEALADRLAADWFAANPQPDDIIQIKGKQNRAPVEDYLPYVQDFVKGGTWGNIGDFGNTGLVKLPDGRFITQAQIEEAASNPGAAKLFGSQENARQQLASWNLKSFSPEEWQQVSPFFEGFAIGGRVAADRCFSRSPFGVRR